MKDKLVSIKQRVDEYCKPIKPFFNTVMIPLLWFGLYAIVQNLWLSNNLLLVVISIIMTTWTLYYTLAHPKVEPYEFASQKTPWLITGLIFLGMFAMIAVESALFNSHRVSANQSGINIMLKYNPYMIMAETAIIAPIFEENIFRRCIINFKNGITVIVTSIISVIIFVFAHMVGTAWTQIPILITYLIPTLCLTGVYVGTRDIKYSMTMHCIYNLIVSLSVLMR